MLFYILIILAVPIFGKGLVESVGVMTTALLYIIPRILYFILYPFMCFEKFMVSFKK